MSNENFPEKIEMSDKLPFLSWAEIEKRLLMIMGKMAERAGPGGCDRWIEDSEPPNA